MLIEVIRLLFWSAAFLYIGYIGMYFFVWMNNLQKMVPPEWKYSADVIPGDANVPFLIVATSSLGDIVTTLFPRAIDFHPDVPTETQIRDAWNKGETPLFWIGAGANALFVWLFMIQHVVMATQSFKVAWMMIVPPRYERPMYCLVSSLVLHALFVVYLPLRLKIALPLEVISDDPAAYQPSYIALGLAVLGGLIVVYSVRFFDALLFLGIRQVYESRQSAMMRLERERRCPITEPCTSGLYGYVRHPMMTGCMLMLWASVFEMSVGRLILSATLTVLMWAAVKFHEEPQLEEEIGMGYVRYKKKVKGRFLPYVF